MSSAGSASSTTAGIIVAAGRGTRFGAPDKVLLPLRGRSVLGWVLDAFLSAGLAEIVIVVGQHTEAAVRTLAAESERMVPVRIVAGGERRQDSVARGVAALGDGIDLVAIHDAARPLVTAALIERTIARARVTGAAIAACPVSDTLKRVRSDLTIESTVSRDALWSAQTPQVFRRGWLTEAIAHHLFARQTFTDEAALFEALGYPVAIVPNHEPNPKITHPGDLALIEALLTMVKAVTEPVR